jgi:hypothetical protein
MHLSRDVYGSVVVLVAPADGLGGGEKAELSEVEDVEHLRWGEREGTDKSVAFHRFVPVPAVTTPPPHARLPQALTHHLTTRLKHEYFARMLRVPRIIPPSEWWHSPCQLCPASTLLPTAAIHP